MVNPLLRDRDVEFLLHEVREVTRLCALPALAEHGRETFDLYLGAARKLARDLLYPAYPAMDQAPPQLVDGRVRVHPVMRTLWPRLVELGVLSATRPPAVGGQSLPVTVASVAAGYLMAANAAAYGYAGLTAGAAHLIEEFGSAALQRDYMEPLYAGRFAGTMALTEPHAGSSLADVATRARRAGDHFLIEGAKVFISGGDHDVTDNVVHLALARIEGAPAGIKGVSLFCVPRLRLEAGRLVDNDCQATGVFHKLGWRGLPSIALRFGERGDCRGWLVGGEHRGIGHMFQMMNEARLMVGMNAAATASVAFHESLEYARTRPQGRPHDSRDPREPQVAIVAHADVRRMLLRQKAIVEGSLALLVACGWYADHAAHAEAPAERHRATLLLDLLTPVAKSFPAERGFESNALAVQVHGGYGYTSEYRPEAWLRDQKLNSIHEGTTGIQGIDLLGRKAVAEGGAALMALAIEVQRDLERAARAGLPAAWCAALRDAVGRVGELTTELARRGAAAGREAMLLHSADFLELFSVVVIAWQWLAMAAAAAEGAARGGPPSERAFYQGKLAAARYWLSSELPRAAHLAELCWSGEPSYAELPPDAL